LEDRRVTEPTVRTRRKLIEVALPLEAINVASAREKDFLAIDLVHRDQRVSPHLVPRLQALVDHGVIERVGRGRGTRYLLSRRFYRFLGRAGTYTRRRGLDRETNKSLLVRHIEDSAATGTTLGELQGVLPDLSRYQVQGLLRALRDEGRVRVQGQRRWARWVPAAIERRTDT
jgi:ATP-dependent DNA helicase RecG